MDDKSRARRLAQFFNDNGTGRGLECCENIINLLDCSSFEAFKINLSDASNYGTPSGCVSGMIYAKDIQAFLTDNFSDIESILIELEEAGITLEEFTTTGNPLVEMTTRSVEWVLNEFQSTLDSYPEEFEQMAEDFEANTDFNE